MRTRFAIYVIIFLVSCMIARAAEPTKPAIVWPTVNPSPAPMPIPGTPVQLDQSMLFVITSDVPIGVLVSPKELATVSTYPSGVVMRGKFVDNPSVWATRTFTAKYVVSVDVGPTSSGPGEVIAFPLSDPSQDERVKIMVGVGPQPGPPQRLAPTPLKKVEAPKLPAYQDALTQALAKRMPLVVWVNCQPPVFLEGAPYVATTATEAFTSETFDGRTPRIMIALYRSLTGKLYWEEDLDPTSNPIRIGDEVRRFLQQPSSVEVFGARPVMMRSC